MAVEIEKHMTPDTELLWVESYAPGVSFYLELPIPVASPDGDEFRSNYILRNADVFLDDEGLLRPVESADRSISDCDGQQIFLLSTKRRDLRDVIEASGVLPLAANRRWMAFGPDCVPGETPLEVARTDGEEVED